MSRVIYKKMLKDAILSKNIDLVDLVIDNIPQGVRYCDNLLIRFAAKKGFSDIIKKYLQFSDPCAQENYAIKKACEFGHAIVVSLLLDDARVCPAASDNYAIIHAAKNGHTDVVRQLLDCESVDPTTNSNMPLRFAAIYNHVDVVELLMLDSRTNAADMNNYAIKWASYYENNDVVKLLLCDPRVDPSIDNNVISIVAAENGNVELIEMLLDDKRVDPSAQDNKLLNWAAINGYLEIIKMVLNHTKINITADRYQYIISNAEHDKNVVKLLADFGSKIWFRSHIQFDLCEHITRILKNEHSVVTAFYINYTSHGKNKLIVEF